MELFGDFTLEELFHGGVFHERGNFSWRMSQIYQHYLKNDQKMNFLKTSFSTENKEQN